MEKDCSGHIKRFKGHYEEKERKKCSQ